MSAPLPQPLILGSPDIGHDLPAWQRRLDGTSSPDALARVKGDFAVGLADRHGRTVLAVDRFATQT